MGTMCLVLVELQSIVESHLNQMVLKGGWGCASVLVFMKLFRKRLDKIFHYKDTYESRIIVLGLPGSSPEHDASQVRRLSSYDRGLDLIPTQGPLLLVIPALSLPRLLSLFDYTSKLKQKGQKNILRISSKFWSEMTPSSYPLFGGLGQGVIQEMITDYTPESLYTFLEIPPSHTQRCQEFPHACVKWYWDLLRKKKWNWASAGYFHLQTEEQLLSLPLTFRLWSLLPALVVVNRLKMCSFND